MEISRRRGRAARRERSFAGNAERVRAKSLCAVDLLLCSARVNAPRSADVLVINARGRPAPVGDDELALILTLLGGRWSSQLLGWRQGPPASRACRRDAARRWPSAALARVIFPDLTWVEAFLLAAVLIAGRPRGHVRGRTAQRVPDWSRASASSRASTTACAPACSSSSFSPLQVAARWRALKLLGERHSAWSSRNHARRDDGYLNAAASHGGITRASRASMRSELGSPRSARRRYIRQRADLGIRRRHCPRRAQPGDPDSFVGFAENDGSIFAVITFSSSGR